MLRESSTVLAGVLLKDPEVTNRGISEAQMKLHGSTEGNLLSAIRSASRLRGQPVHVDTLKYWSDLIRHARDELSSRVGLPPESLRRLVAELEVEVGRRPR